LGDTVVGPQYAAPTGRTPWWVPDRPGEFAHVGTMTDPRILADALRRLRGEKPWTTDPPASLPKDPEQTSSAARGYDPCMIGRAFCGGLALLVVSVAAASR